MTRRKRKRKKEKEKKKKKKRETFHSPLIQENPLLLGGIGLVLEVSPPVLERIRVPEDFFLKDEISLGLQLRNQPRFLGRKEEKKKKKKNSSYNERTGVREFA